MKKKLDKGYSLLADQRPNGFDLSGSPQAEEDRRRDRNHYKIVFSRIQEKLRNRANNKCEILNRGQTENSSIENETQNNVNNVGKDETLNNVNNVGEDETRNNVNNVGEDETQNNLNNLKNSPDFYF